MAERIERYIPAEKVDFTSCPVAVGKIQVGGQTFAHLETADFPISDPWSKFMRNALAQGRQEDVFRGQPILELGIGDGRNIREAGPGISNVCGVDIERWRLQTAGANLVTGSARLEIPIELWRADAIDFLREYRAITSRARFSGWVIMCLPQSPSGLNTADRYDGASNLNSYRTDWDKCGLTLNAAALDNLREVTAFDTRVLVILSDRVPPQIRNRMITETGWQIEKEFQTREPIQQDPDTGIEWVAGIDDGSRFYELVASGYSAISALEAEKRRLASLRSGKGRDELNAYHHLGVYQLRRRKVSGY